MHRKSLLGVSVLVLVVLLSCRNPFNRLMLLQVKDAVGPAITITSPAEGSSYAATVAVAGTVKDSSTAPGDAGTVGSLRYEVLATAIAGEVAVLQGGSFGFQFSTANLSGTLVVKLTAEDWNGNTVAASLTLVDRGAVPSFSADPGNAQVTLTWNPVPLADHYTIYYEKTNAIPNELYSLKIEDVSSPLIISNLVNGNMHTFLLRSHSTEGEDNWSEIAKAIPLSPAQLAPILTPGFKDILVEWEPVPATEEYEVWKSSSPTGSFLNVSGVIRGNSFRDSSVVHGQHYYYSIKPALYSNHLSGMNASELNHIPANSDREAGSFDTPGFAVGVAVSGSYAYVADETGGLRIINIANPALPSEVGFCETPGSSYGVAVTGSYAYVADIGSGLRIINISNPALPSEVGFFETSDAAVGVAVSGSYAYVGDDTGGLRIISISNPALPSEVGFFDTPGSAYSVAVSGNHAYAADGDSGLRIIRLAPE